MRARILPVLLFALLRVAWAQVGASPAVPITNEPSHHLVLENEYVRVFKVEVAPHSEMQVHQHDLDYVFVTLGDSDVENGRVGEKPVRLQLKDGETRFTKGGFAHKAVNRSDRPFVNVTVELKNPVATGSETLFDRCEGQVCHRDVLVSPKTRCTQYSSIRGGGVNLAKGRNYLLIAASNVTTTDAKRFSRLNRGDSIWITEATTVTVGNGIFAVCEFVN